MNMLFVPNMDPISCSFYREVLFSLDESEKIFGGNYGSSSNTQWKHYKVQIKPSRYEKQVTF